MQCGMKETNVPTAQRISPLFHCSSLLARSYLIRDEFKPSRVDDYRSMHRPIFQPLWEDADTFTDEQLADFKARANELNSRFDRLTAVFGGPTKSPFKAFHNDLDANMCYIEDILHDQCAHWADKPRVYHRCAAEDPDTGTCYHRKAYGSACEDSICPRCEVKESQDVKLATEAAAEARKCVECGHTSKRKRLRRFRSVLRRTWVQWKGLSCGSPSKARRRPGRKLEDMLRS